MAASEVTLTWRAVRLAALVSGGPDLADADTLAKTIELLGDLEPTERATVADRAIKLGADPTWIEALLGIAGGEVIQVSSTAPRDRGRYLWWILGGLALAGGVTYGVARHHRKRRRALPGAGA